MVAPSCVFTRTDVGRPEGRRTSVDGSEHLGILFLQLVEIVQDLVVSGGRALSGFMIFPHSASMLYLEKCSVAVG